MNKSTVGLCMIVKNEEIVIERCLKKLINFVDYWTIVDTGSTDNTKKIIKKILKNKPGKLYSKPWKNFAFNRSQAINLARNFADYSLIIDADDELITENNFQWPLLDKDAYIINIHDSSLIYQRIQLIKNSKPWKYEGVLHEYLTQGNQGSEEILNNIYMKRNHDGARRRDSNTYYNDVKILEKALEEETREDLRIRYTFYLAQSYRDCKNFRKSIEYYNKRSSMGGWQQEVYVSYLNSAQLKETINDPIEEIIEIYKKAIMVDPTRAEAFYGISSILRKCERFSEACFYALQAINLVLPKNGLFVVEWMYQYGILDELSVSSYWSGNYYEAIRCGELMLSQGFIPEHEKSRIETNLIYSKEKLLKQTSWVPINPQGGTEIMIDGLKKELGEKLDKINLCINSYDIKNISDKPLVVWIHHDINQQFVQWMYDVNLRNNVDVFVFVSHWQREQYEKTFNIDTNKSFVLKNAANSIDFNNNIRHNNRTQCAYISTPFRGLDILLDSWEEINPDADLHIWSSMKLYGQNMSDNEYNILFDKAKSLPNVYYHNIVPNLKLRELLNNIDFLLYPSTFRETSCLSVIESMMAGCRIICPQLGALPETTSGFASLYPYSYDKKIHKMNFIQTFKEELINPWYGNKNLQYNQQVYSNEIFSWKTRKEEWLRFIEKIRKF